MAPATARLTGIAVSVSTSGGPSKEVAMVLLPQAVRAAYEHGFPIRLTFNDPTEGAWVFTRGWQGPVFWPRKRVAYVKKLFIGGGTVVWPTGADIAPETRTRLNAQVRPHAATGHWEKEMDPPGSAHVAFGIASLACGLGVFFRCRRAPTPIERLGRGRSSACEDSLFRC